MFTVLFTLLVVALVAYALWSAARGEGSRVDGAGNNYDAYYGKDRFDPGKSPPCDECTRYGCIGSGECRCICHKPFRKKK
jgi:hypothetical protein